MSLPSDPDSLASCTKGGSSSALSYTEVIRPSTRFTYVIEAPKVLYALNPGYEESVSEHDSALNFAQKSIPLSISFIAYSLLHASKRMLSAIPVQVVAAPHHIPKHMDILA